MPSTWRSTVQDPQTLNLLIHFYSVGNPPSSSKAMECVILLCSVRRSLFLSDKDRSAFLVNLLSNITALMRDKTGMQHMENYHQFCRLLGRLKANYQLSELVKAPVYTEWLGLCKEFTRESFQNWHETRNSVHYLLALFGRLVAAVPYVRNDGKSERALEEAVVQVVESYLDSMLSSVGQVVNSGYDDPLDDAGGLLEQMEVRGGEGLRSQEREI